MTDDVVHDRGATGLLVHPVDELADCCTRRNGVLDDSAVADRGSAEAPVNNDDVDIFSGEESWKTIDKRDLLHHQKNDSETLLKKWVKAILI